MPPYKRAAPSLAPRTRMMEVNLAETRPHAPSPDHSCDTQNGPDASGTTNVPDKRPTGGARCAAMVCVRGCGGRAHATCMRANMRCRGGRAARAAAAAAARTAAATGGSEIILMPFWPNSLSWMSSPGGRTRSEPFSSACDFGEASCAAAEPVAARPVAYARAQSSPIASVRAASSSPPAA